MTDTYSFYIYIYINYKKCRLSGVYIIPIYFVTCNIFPKIWYNCYMYYLLEAFSCHFSLKIIYYASS